MNILEAIPTLYTINQVTKKYKVEFDDMGDARNFDIGVRKQFEDLGVEHWFCYKMVSQRNTNVFIDLELAKAYLKNPEKCISDYNAPKPEPVASKL